jgi:hypothetical protein
MSESSVISTIDSKELDKVLLSEGVIASTTVGVSMRPLFKTRRDMVVIRAVSDQLKKYDVALYKVGDKFVMHRVVGIAQKEKKYLIRGDNTYVLERVPFDSVVGVLESFNRKGKHRSVTDKAYIFYSRLWCAIYPVRYIVRLPYVFLRRILRPVKRALKGKQ